MKEQEYCRMCHGGRLHPTLDPNELKCNYCRWAKLKIGCRQIVWRIKAQTYGHRLVVKNVERPLAHGKNLRSTHLSIFTKYFDRRSIQILAIRLRKDVFRAPLFNPLTAMYEVDNGKYGTYLEARKVRWKCNKCDKLFQNYRLLGLRDKLHVICCF